MWDLLLYIVAPLMELLGGAFAADDRRAARRLTLGCAVLLGLAFAVVALFLAFHRSSNP